MLYKENYVPTKGEEVKMFDLLSYIGLRWALLRPQFVIFCINKTQEIPAYYLYIFTKGRKESPL